MPCPRKVTCRKAAAPTRSVATCHNSPWDTMAHCTRSPSLISDALPRPHSCFPQSGVIGDTFYTFSGEHVPRVPLDNEVYALDLTSGQWTKLPASASSPVARVGHAAAVANHKLYVYGGRIGKQFADKTLDDLHAYDPSNNTWQPITPNSATRPPPLSYHSLTASPTHVYLFGGCTVDHGRSSALWAFDIATGDWQQLAESDSQNGPRPCGGPSFVYTPNPPTVHALFGYSGKEELDTHYTFTLATPTTSASGWQLQPQSTGDRPAPRSVTDTVYLPALNALFTFGGEFTASAQGHEGAGSYHDSAYLYRLDEAEWVKVSDGGSGSGGPSARGWFNTCALADGRSAVVFGGFDGTARVNDVFVWTAES